MAFPRLRETMEAGDLVLSAWSGLTDPMVHEALARSPFDAVTFDMQHGLHDLASVREGIARVALLGKPAIVRLALEDRANAARFLDFGASAVVMPMIEGADDARAFVEAVKYPPLGLRSFGPGRAAELHGYASAVDYTAAANAGTLAFAMIETRAAMDNLGAILSLDGLDGVFVGPSDLSIALSGTGTLDTGSEAAVFAIQAIAEAAQARGKLAAIYAVTPDEARLYASFGYRLVCIASDLGFLKAGAFAVEEAVRG